MASKRGLGKGIGALITSREEYSEMEEERREGVVEVDINKIEPDMNQPRKHFDEETLKELAESIKQFGVIQPLLVKKEEGFYSIIAGERRWRAARIAKLAKVPVIIKDYDNLEKLQVSLIENVQRTDLNPIEEALCYKRLADEFHFSHEEIAEKVGKSRSAISNSMRLLALSERVQMFVFDGKMSIGHAKVLLAVKDHVLQLEIAEKILEDDLSVRYVEELVRKLDASPLREVEKTPKLTPKKLPIYKNLENDLKNILGTKVSIKHGKGNGKIEIDYHSNEDLDRLVQFLKSKS